jgi:very-short-patch-repair endonuclease
MSSDPAFVSIRERLLKERHSLLDLSSRNRLLNTPLRTRNNRAIEIVDEKASEVFRLLTTGKALTFLPGVQLSEEEKAELDPDDDITGGIPQPEDDRVDDRGVASRHADLRLQTRLTSEGLQKRLFDVWYDAQTLEQEQGVNVLYLAIGLLKWFDNDASDVARHAPLVLLPVKLERISAADKFKLKWREEPPSVNLTLQAKMKAEFSILIEDFSDEDEVNLTAYCEKVAATVANQKRWEALPDSMVLGFFSFSKFLMYRDLDPDNWPSDAAIDAHPLVSGLLRDGFPHSAPLVAEGAPIDDVIPPIELHHVVDADSSQTVAIAEVAGGRTLVVKGPPGTGKSQTITNIIAAAVARDKKVLFVAEKMAALDVVHRRLQQVGLGPLTLELHSNKVNKRTVLEELKRTRDAQLRPPRSDLTVVQKLGDASNTLNGYAKRLHTPLQPCDLTPQAILGRLIRNQASTVLEGFLLSGAETWNREAVAQRQALAHELTDRHRALGAIPQHPWRGVARGPVDPIERNAIMRTVEALARRLEAIIANAAVATEILGVAGPITVSDFAKSLDALQVMPLPTGTDRPALALPEWTTLSLDDAKQLIHTGRAYLETWTIAEAAFNAAGTAADLAAVRNALATKGASLFRFLHSGYRSQIALLRSYLKGPAPRSQSARITLVDQMIAAQTAKAQFEALAQRGAVFGKLWKGERSDWNLLDAIVDWRSAHASFSADVWRRLAETGRLEELQHARSSLFKDLPQFHSQLGALFSDLELDVQRAFSTSQTGEIEVATLASRLQTWISDPESMSAFIAFAAVAKAFADMGCAELVDAIHDGRLTPNELVPAFDRSYAEVLRVALLTAWPELRGFDGDSHNALVDRFRQLDVARIGLAQEQIVAAHAEGRPRGAAGIGPLGVLNAEIARKRGHLPIRLLIERAGPAIQQLKPVFMMSPLSVAQFLKPGGLTFDLLVMDEASQIEPVDALGSVARAGQLVVVGDERQLPPTAFFRKLTGEEDPEEGDGGVTIQAKDAESILELCLAKGVPYRMLAWHYRSKHQSLIAVSNREFYENKLFIVPSPYDAIAGMGLKFNLVKNAPYDRGGTRTNPVEAKIIAETVIRHAREHPEKSLGVATFSVSQRQAVLKELELLRRVNSDVEEFFGTASIEPFFVKNLENIQGDERDVIFISVGYGKTEQGYLAHAFGPLSGEGGERRLNVLISRAKLRCEVFCNFTGADIDLERTRSRGVAALKLFLTFAETGHFGLGETTGADFDSDFEAQVSERLQHLGYDVKRQIGASGFRVDLAVSDPEKPGRFVLGIECDGAQFHSSRSARDRDRLRQQVLEAHGWIIHRIWSTDWYMRPQQELKKVEAAIAAAKAAWRDRDGEGIRQSKAVPVSFEGYRDGDTEVVTAVMEDGSTFSPEPKRVYYTEATFNVNAHAEPHETPLSEMAGYITKIVKIEGPIHLDEIVTRIRVLWGLGRAGARIRAAVERAVNVAVQSGVIRGGPFYSAPDQAVIARDRSQVGSSTLRKPEMLPPDEIDEAVLRLVDENFGAGRDDLVQAVSRVFGYAATSAQLRQVLMDGLDRLVGCGALIEKGQLLVREKAKARLI